MRKQNNLKENLQDFFLFDPKKANFCTLWIYWDDFTTLILIIALEQQFSVIGLFLLCWPVRKTKWQLLVLTDPPSLLSRVGLGGGHHYWLSGRCCEWRCVSFASSTTVQPSSSQPPPSYLSTVLSMLSVILRFTLYSEYLSVCLCVCLSVCLSVHICDILLLLSPPKHFFSFPPYRATLWSATLPWRSKVDEIW